MKFIKVSPVAIKVEQEEGRPVVKEAFDIILEREEGGRVVYRIRPDTYSSLPMMDILRHIEMLEGSEAEEVTEHESE
jgi:hypothetical protein